MGGLMSGFITGPKRISLRNSCLIGLKRKGVDKQKTR